MTAETHDVAIQTSSSVVVLDGSSAPSNALASHKPKAALVYAALLGAKHEANEAPKLLLAQVHNDHANFPHEI